MTNKDRLEREIEEILGKIEQFPEPESRARMRRRRAFNQATARIATWQEGVARQLSRISLSQVMLISFLIILGSFFFRGRAIPPTLSSWLLVAGIILFISTFAVMVLWPRSRGSRDQRWRGRAVEPRRGPTLSQRLRHWFGGRARRR
jgi:hypothetical protein